MLTKGLGVFESLSLGWGSRVLSVVSELVSESVSSDGITGKGEGKAEERKRVSIVLEVKRGKFLSVC